MESGMQIGTTGNQDIVMASKEPQWSQSKYKSISKDRNYAQGNTHNDKWDLCNQRSELGNQNCPNEDYKLMLHKYKERR